MSKAAETTLLERIEELETRLAFQEQTIETINSAFYQLQQDQQRLVTQFEWLAQKSRELAERMPAGGQQDDAPPPHY